MRDIKANLSECKFTKSTKTLVMSFPSCQFPDVVKLTSNHTGKVIEFVRDTAAAEQNEWWDGEMYEYKPIEEVPNVVKLVLTGAY